MLKLIYTGLLYREKGKNARRSPIERDMQGYRIPILMTKEGE